MLSKKYWTVLPTGCHGPNGGGHTRTLGPVLGVHTGGESVGRVVGQPDGLGFGAVKAVYGHDGTKGFVFGNVKVVI